MGASADDFHIRCQYFYKAPQACFTNNRTQKLNQRSVAANFQIMLLKCSQQVPFKK